MTAYRQSVVYTERASLMLRELTLYERQKVESALVQALAEAELHRQQANGTPTQEVSGAFIVSGYEFLIAASEAQKRVLGISPTHGDGKALDRLSDVLIIIRPYESYPVTTISDSYRDLKRLTREQLLAFDTAIQIAIADIGLKMKMQAIDSCIVRATVRGLSMFLLMGPNGVKLLEIRPLLNPFHYITDLIPISLGGDHMTIKPA